MSFNRSVALNASATLLFMALALYIGTFQSLGRAQCLCHCQNISLCWNAQMFQSLGRAQCLCHVPEHLSLLECSDVSIARSRSMPLPRSQRFCWISEGVVSIARSRSMPLPQKDTAFQMQLLQFQSLGRAQCLCHSKPIVPAVPRFLSFNRSVALNASATHAHLLLRTAKYARFNRSVALNASATVFTVTKVPLPFGFNRSVALNASATISSVTGQANPPGFQSLGRAQCLCHADMLAIESSSIHVSIARSRSMPLPRITVRLGMV